MYAYLDDFKGVHNYLVWLYTMVTVAVRLSTKGNCKAPVVQLVLY